MLRTPALLIALLLTALAAAGFGSAADPADAPPANKLSDDEVKAGWKLLFDGKSFAGWHTFKQDGVRPGWQVKDGTLACVDPHKAGDLATTDKYDWFELSLEYNISEGGNSGVMFHVTNDGNAIWATGPEVQLEDNVKAADPIRCGWLYQLYQPENDPKTGKPLDATKPVGEWNQMRHRHRPSSRQVRSQHQRREVLRFRLQQRRLQGPRGQEQVPGHAGVRQVRQRLHRPPGRPRLGGVPQHQAPADPARGRA